MLTQRHVHVCTCARERERERERTRRRAKEAREEKGVNMVKIHMHVCRNLIMKTISVDKIFSKLGKPFSDRPVDWHTLALYLQHRGESHKNLLSSSR